MQSGFTEAICGVRHRVFGYVLRPLSAAHVVALDAANLPIMRGGAEAVTASSLCLAAKICAGKVRLINGAYQPDVNWRATWRDSYRVAVCESSESAFAKQCQAFADYIADYAETPRRMIAKDAKEPSRITSPVAFYFVMQMIPLVGEQRAWSMPYGLLKTMLEVRAEAEGADIRFEPDAHESSLIQEQLERAEAAGRKLMEQMKNA